MYSNDKKGFSILDIIIKFILFGLFIFILVWLFNKKIPNMTPFYSNVFRENIKYMQEAAESYFTDDKMPKNVGDEVKMNLSEMIDKKIILPFVDKDGNACDLYNSYVTITKQKDESYILKTNLECGKEKDYTIKVLGCHTYCKEKDCEKTCKIEKLTSYQYKKLATSTTTKYTCPSGYTLKGKECYKTVLKDTKDAETKVTDTKTYTEDALVKVITGKTTYSCPDGYTREGSGSSLKCYKNITTYTCPTGYTKEGSGSTLKCYIKETTYSCPSGYTAEGYGSNMKCYKNTTTYSCPSGYTAEGSGSSLKCYKNTTTYTCPSGYTKEGSGSSLKCYKNTTTYSCPSGTTSQSGSGSSLKCYKKTDDKTTCTTISVPEKYQCNCTTKTVNFKPQVSCSTCTRYISKESCTTTPGTTTELKPETKTTTTYTDKEITTTKTYTDKETKTTTTYTDKNISVDKVYTDKLKNTTKKYIDKITTKQPDTTTYYCKDNSWTLKGEKCTKTVKEESIVYNCPKDYKLEGKLCKKYTTETIKATSKKVTKEYYKYTWSTKTSLEGWTRTGKTKTVNGKEICE